MKRERNFVQFTVDEVYEAEQKRFNGGAVKLIFIAHNLWPLSDAGAARLIHDVFYQMKYYACLTHLF